MTTTEISDRFDYQLNKVASGMTLDEYNKSLYLTKAQMAVITHIAETYEYGEFMRQQLSPVLKSVRPPRTTTPAILSGIVYKKEPIDMLAIVWEIFNGIPVIPLDMNDIHMIIDNPFRKPDSNIAYRLTFEDSFEIVSSSKLKDYMYICIVPPKPIVLEDLPDGLEVSGVTEAQTCEFRDSIVYSIIDMAVAAVVKDMKTTVSPQPQPQPQQQPQQQQ